MVLHEPVPIVAAHKLNESAAPWRQIAGWNSPGRPGFGRVLIEVRRIPGGRAHSMPRDDHYVLQLRGNCGNSQRREESREDHYD